MLHEPNNNLFCELLLEILPFSPTVSVQARVHVMQMILTILVTGLTVVIPVTLTGEHPRCSDNFFCDNGHV